MASSLRLHIILWIPIAVNDISSRQVETDATCPRGKQENKRIGLIVESIDGLMTLVTTHATIQALVREIAIIAKVGNQIQHSNHLTENQHLVTLGAQLRMLTIPAIQKNCIKRYLQ